MSEADHYATKKNCGGCRYLRVVAAGCYYCDYIGTTGTTRPCPAGKGCIVRKDAKKKRVGPYDTPPGHKKLTKKEIYG